MVAYSLNMQVGQLLMSQVSEVIKRYVAFVCCRERLIDYWLDQNMLTADGATRIFSVLKQHDKNYVTQVGTFSMFQYLLNICSSVPHVMGS